MNNAMIIKSARSDLFEEIRELLELHGWHRVSETPPVRGRYLVSLEMVPGERPAVREMLWKGNIWSSEGSTATKDYLEINDRVLAWMFMPKPCRDELWKKPVVEGGGR